MQVLVPFRPMPRWCLISSCWRPARVQSQHNSFPQMVVGVEWCQHSFYGEVEQDTIGKKQPFYQVKWFLCLVGVTGWCFLFWQEPLKSDWKKPGCWTMGQMPAKMVRCPPSTLKIVKSSFYVLTRCAQQFSTLDRHVAVVWLTSINNRYTKMICKHKLSLYWCVCQFVTSCSYQQLQRGAKWFRYRVSIHHRVIGTPLKVLVLVHNHIMTQPVTLGVLTAAGSMYDRLVPTQAGQTKSNMFNNWTGYKSVVCCCCCCCCCCCWRRQWRRRAVNEGMWH